MQSLFVLRDSINEIRKMTYITLYTLSNTKFVEPFLLNCLTGGMSIILKYVFYVLSSVVLRQWLPLPNCAES